MASEAAKKETTWNSTQTHTGFRPHHFPGEEAPYHVSRSAISKSPPPFLMIQHTLNLLVEGAWAKLADGWPSKVATMIANFNKSSSMMAALEKRQTAALIPQLKLLDWNDTRWTGQLS